MKKALYLGLISLFAFCNVLSASEITGFWKTVDEKSGKARSLVAIYEYQNKYYGRIIATYDDNGKIEDSIEAPKDRAPGVVGEPFYSGLDFIWNLEKNDKGTLYTNGRIMDPEKGRIYDAQMWRKDGNGNLMVRGAILFFGRNQEWIPAYDKDFPSGFKKPDLTKLVPTIPKVK